MSTDNKRHIVLQPLNTGDLLTEVSRAYLHGGNPSVLIKRIGEGVAKHIEERAGGERLEPAERQILGSLQFKLDLLYEELKSLEEYPLQHVKSVMSSSPSMTRVSWMAGTLSQ